MWTLEERRNRSDLIEVFKMFSGYTEIDIKVLFTLDGNDKGLRGRSKKICKVRFNIDVRNPTRGSGQVGSGAVRPSANI